MKTPVIMRTTLAALLPGTAAWCYVFGAGAFINLGVAIVTAIAVEAAVLKIRSKPLARVFDGTVVLTGALLGLCLPPLLPIWLVVLGVAFAVIFGKHLYGGMGNNVFNPAMIGFAMLIVSFPLAMSTWPESSVDGISAATPLDAYRFRGAATNDEFFTDAVTVNWHQWLWINVAFLAGGLVLLQQKIIPWQTPVAFTATLAVLSIAFYDGGSSASLGSPLFHLFSGATMLAAFFILTDPVTCPSSHRGLLAFGVGVGLITFIIRTHGAYPEGVAFGVLLMNAATPLIDHVLLKQGKMIERGTSA